MSRLDGGGGGGRHGCRDWVIGTIDCMPILGIPLAPLDTEWPHKPDHLDYAHLDAGGLYEPGFDAQFALPPIPPASFGCFAKTIRNGACGAKGIRHMPIQLPTQSRLQVAKGGLAIRDLPFREALPVDCR